MDNDEDNILRGPTLGTSNLNRTVGEEIFYCLKSHNPYDVIMCEAETQKTVTSPEFLGLSVRVAEKLKAEGLQPEDVVSLVGIAGIDAYAVATGTLFLGGIVAPVDNSVGDETFSNLLEAIDPKFMFCDSDIVDIISEILTKIKSKAKIVIMKHDTKKKTRFMVFEKFIKPQVHAKNFQPVSLPKIEDVVAFLVCSSGTRGTPKPVMITHTGLLHQVESWRAISELDKTLRCPSIVFSFFHWISGVLLYLVVLCLDIEMTIVQKLEAKHVLEVIERHKPVWGMFSPTFAKYLSCYPEFKKFNVSSLGLMITGGCILQKVVMRKIQEVWGPQITCKQAYGLTEISGSATMSSRDDDSLSVGKLLPGFQLKVVSLKDGRVLGPNQEGEIYLKSPTVMKGYLKNEEASNAVLNNTWFRSEDLGYYTPTGVVYITGRVKDLIRVNDTQVSPYPLEELILELEGVIDVGVAGLSVDEGNFDLAALVVKIPGSKVTEQNVIDMVKDKLGYELKGGVYFVEDIPKTSSGKMKRGRLYSMIRAFQLDD